MRVLVVGPSDTKSRGGMATVINGIRNSKDLNQEYEIDIFPSYIDGNIAVRLFYSIKAYFIFLHLYKKYDLFHLHTASYGSTFRKRFYLKIIKKAGKKVIVHIHGAKYLVFYNSLNRRMQEKVIDFLNDADIVLALSEKWKKDFEETFNLTNCEVLHNGINTNFFANSVCDLEKNKNNFLFLGRLGERKGAYDLVNAVEIALKQNPNIKLFMAGDGEIEKIKMLVANKKLQNNIEVIGWIDLQEKIKFLKKVDTLVLPSYNEGLPMAILEGMASGKAIISTNVGAIPEVIKEENGILIKPGEVETLASAIVECSQNMKRIQRMSENNIQKANTEFSVEVMHRRLAEFYESAIKCGCNED